jgi:hypothetical protein
VWKKWFRYTEKVTGAMGEPIRVERERQMNESEAHVRLSVFLYR